METKEIFAKRVIELRREKEISQSQLAELVGISKTSANLYESASRVPDIQVLARYTKELGVTADYLLGLSDNRTPETSAIGEKLGLTDSAIEHLCLYKKISDCVQNLRTDEPSEESYEVLKSIAAERVLGKTVEEVADNSDWIGIVISQILSNGELLCRLIDYLYGYKEERNDGLTEEERTAVSLIKLQACILNLHEHIKEYI